MLFLGEIVTSCFQKQYTFQASTYQMIILLQFNHRDEMSFAELQANTMIKKVCKRIDWRGTKPKKNNPESYHGSPNSFFGVFRGWTPPQRLVLRLLNYRTNSSHSCSIPSDFVGAVRWIDVNARHSVWTVCISRRNRATCGKRPRGLNCNSVDVGCDNKVISVKVCSPRRQSYSKFDELFSEVSRVFTKIKSNLPCYLVTIKFDSNYSHWAFNLSFA